MIFLFPFGGIWIRSLEGILVFFEAICCCDDSCEGDVKLDNFLYGGLFQDMFPPKNRET